MKAILAVLVALAVAGCGVIRQRELQARVDELKAKTKEAEQQCNVTWPAGNPKTAVPRARCQTEALAIMRPIAPYPDLIDLFIASRIAIAERVQNGQVTIAQANEAIATKRSEIIAEEQRRQLANRSVSAQENAAAASLAAAGPHSCTAVGNTVNCF
jgi:hypothetical protein